MSSELGKYLILTKSGEILHTSDSNFLPYEFGGWLSCSSKFVISSQTRSLVVDKFGQILLERNLDSADSLSAVAVCSKKSQAYFLHLNGEVFACPLLLAKPLTFKNYMVDCDDSGMIRVKNLVTNYVEVLEHNLMQVNLLDCAYDQLVIVQGKKQFIYHLDNLLTPVQINITMNSTDLMRLNNENCAIYDSTQNHFHIISMTGKPLSIIKTSRNSSSKNISPEHFSLNCESLFVTENCSVKRLDIASGVEISSHEHSSEIVLVKSNNSFSSSSRKVLFIDINKNLYVYWPLKKKSILVGEQVKDCIWHDHLDVFVYISEDQLQINYSPESLFIDSHLFEMSNESYSLISATCRLLSLHSSIIETFCTSSKTSQNYSLDSQKLSLIKIFQSEDSTETILANSLKLCRFLNNNQCWAMLAAKSLSHSDLSTGEICFAQLGMIDKVRLINQIQSSDQSQIQSLLLVGNKDKALREIREHSDPFVTVKLYVKNFKFKEALERAAQTDFSWMKDYVLHKRKRYLEETRQEEQENVFLNEMTQLDFEAVKQKKHLYLNR
jgi:hypothetical protein